MSAVEYRRAEVVDFRAVAEIAPRGARVLLLALAYYVAVRVGLGFRFQNSAIGVVWLANAVLLSALLLTPKAHWWLVFVTTAAAHIAAMSGTAPVWRWSWQIVGNSAYAVVTVAMLRRFAGLPLLFESRRQVLAYTALAFVMPALFAFAMPSFVRSLLHLETTFPPAGAWLRTLLSNATALLLVAPALLVWGEGGFGRLRAFPARRLIEAAAILIALLAVGALAFGSGPEMARYPTLLLLVFPPLLWAAVRFGPGAAATALFCVAALSMWGTAHQLGPFVLVTQVDRVVSLQTFWIILYLPVMLLAASIREREQAEAALQEQRNQLAHVTRVTTVGELSGALAHELRQPLTSILANARAGLLLLRAGSENVEEVRGILEDIAQQDRQAESVIDHLRSFLKKGAPHFEPVALDTLVRNAMDLAHGTIVLAGVAVETDVTPGLPPVRGDAVQLLQVVLNLLVNACESMSHVPEDERRLRLQLTSTQQGYVQLEITDRGVGLPAGNDEVFKPFFTTKEHGLGLGLAIARSIITAHGGRLWAENNSHGGATFHLELAEGGARVMPQSS
jgi:signal transduction histidine kinase